MSASSRLSLTLASVLLISLVCLAAADSTPASISTPSCDRSGNVVNNLKGIPRLNAKAKLINSDLGTYTWYTCTAANSSDCDWYNPFEGGVKLSNLYGGQPAVDSPENVIQGYGVLVAFAIVMALLSLVIGLSICIGRYCCCCIRGGTCGKRWPTIKTRCCGIQPNLVTGQMEYSPRERWCARSYMWLFVIFTVVWILMSYGAGTGSIPSSMKAIANSPEPLIQTLQGLSVPIRDLIVGLSTTTLVQLVDSVRDAVSNTTDLNALVNNMTCIVNLTSAGKLPNVTVLSSVITALSNEVSAINATLASTSTVLTGVNAQIANVTDSIVAIEDDTWLLDGSIAAGVASLKAINDSLAVLAVLSANISNPDTGAPYIISSLNGTSTALPNSTAVSDATTDLTELVNPNSYTFTQTDQVQQLLEAINTSYSTSPDYSQTATDLVDMEADIAYVNQLDIFATIDNQVDDAQYDIANISASILAINGSINAVALQVQSFDFTAPTTLLLAINGSTSQLPAVFATLQWQLGLVQPLLGVLPCFYAAVWAAESFNVTLVQLPPEFNSIVTLGPTLNSTLTSAISTVDEVQAEITTFQLQLAAFNISTYLQQLSTMQSLAANHIASLTSGSDVAMLNSAYGQAQSADFSGVDQLMTLNSTMNDIAFNSTLVDSLDVLEQAKLAAESLMAVIIPDLYHINNYGYCSDDGLQCTVDTQCTAPATCLSTPAVTSTPKTQRCAANGVSDCTDDVDCGPSDHCIVDTNRYSWLRDNITLIQYATPESDVVNPLVDQLNAVMEQTDPSTNGLSSVDSTISATVDSLDSVSLSDVNATLMSLTASLTTFNTAGVQSEVDSVQSALGEVDLASAQSTVDSLSSSIDEVNDDVGDLIQAQQLVTAIRDLLFYQLPIYLEAIDQANLLQAYSDGGLTAMATAVLQLVDNSTAFINNTDFITPTQLTTTLLTTDIKHYLDVLSTPAYSHYGPVYFIAMLAYKDKTLDLSTYPSNDLSRFNKDVNGNSYANDSYCLSSECIDSTIDYYTGTDLKTVSSGSVPLSISAIHALSIPLVIPAVIALLGLLSSLMYRSAAWASCCSSCTACMIFVVMPIIFVLAGIVWPLLVVGVSDVCSGGVSIGNQYIRAQAPSLCTNTLSGTITADNQCYINPATNVSVTFDIAAVYASIAGSSCSATNDPMATIFAQLSSTVSSYPVDKIDDAIDNINDGSSAIRIRPTLINIARAAAQSSGALFTTTIGTVGEQLGCGALSATFEDVKAAFCCTTATTLYWAVGAWYLIAFTMLLCGWQAALLGRKRFANQIWGPGRMQHTLTLHTAVVALEGWCGKTYTDCTVCLCVCCPSCLLCLAEVVPLVNGDALSHANMSSAPAAFTVGDQQQLADQPTAGYESNPDYMQQPMDDGQQAYYGTQQPTGDYYQPQQQQHMEQAQAQSGYETRVPGLAEEQSLVGTSRAGSKPGSRAASRQASRQGSRQASRQGSRANSRRPSQVRTENGPLAVVVHDAESNYGTMSEERMSPIMHDDQHTDIASSSAYTAMYPTLDRSSSVASEPEYQYQQPGHSPDLRGQALLAGYPDQSPSPIPTTPSALHDEDDD